MGRKPSKYSKYYNSEQFNIYFPISALCEKLIPRKHGDNAESCEEKKIAK